MRRLLPIVTVLLLATPAVAQQPSFSMPDPRIDALQQDWQLMSRSTDHLKRAIQDLITEYQTLQAKNRDLQAEIDRLRAQLPKPAEKAADPK